MSDKADGGSKKARQPAKYRVKVYKKTETAKYYGIFILLKQRRSRKGNSSESINLFNLSPDITCFYFRLKKP